MNLSISGMKLQLSCAFQDIIMGWNPLSNSTPAVSSFKFKRNTIFPYSRQKKESKCLPRTLLSKVVSEVNAPVALWKFNMPKLLNLGTYPKLY